MLGLGIVLDYVSKLLGSDYGHGKFRVRGNYG